MKLKGFKSFANSTDIKFNNQITAIVGPNGSGKSNISDAIRWVLGEQSAKSLRGNSMEDIIFSGTDEKKPLNYAEVSLFFSNLDRKLDIDYDEVSITRRIYRDNQSNFKINNHEVRLKDIKELFLDTGIGKDGYSIISQGRIDSVINSSAKERRILFEEASGISKYKYRKIESEKNLSKVNDDLKIIDTDFEYKKKELELLKKQYDNQNKYEKLKDEINKLAKSYYVFKYEDINTNIRNYKNELNLNTKKIDRLNNSLNKLNNGLEPIAKNINSIKNKIENLDNTISKSKEEYDKKIKNIEICKQKSEFLNKDIDRINEDNKKFESNSLNLSDKINEADKNIKKSTELVNNINQEIKDLEKLINDNNILESKKEEELSILIEKLEKINDKIYNLEVDLKTQSNLSKRNEEVKSKLENEISNLKIKIEKNEEVIKKNTEYKDDLSLKLKEIIEKLDELKDKKIKIENKLFEINKKTNQIELKISQLIASFKTSQKLYGNNEGYYYQIQEFLNKTKNTQYEKYYISTLSNLINVNDKYESVIETLLSSSLQNIVTRNQEETKVLIDYINKYSIGRITFLPIDKIKGIRRQRPNFPEVIDMAYDIIDYDEKLDNIIYHFLGNCVIVKDIKDAINLSNKITGYRIITLNLDIINTWGSMVAGKLSKNRANTNLLNRKKRLRDQKLEIVKYNKLLAKFKDSIQQLKRNEKEIDQKIKITDQEVSLLEEQIRNLLEKNEKISLTNENNKNNLNRFKLDMQSLVDEKSDQKEYKILVEQRDELKAKYDILVNELNSTKNKISEYKKQNDKLRNKLEIAKRDIFIYNNNKSELSNSLDNLLQDHKMSIKIKNQLKEELIESSKKIEKEESLTVDFLEKIKENKKNKSNLINEKVKLEKQIEEDKNEIDEKNKEIKQIDILNSKMRLNLDNAKDKLNDLINDVNNFLIDIKIENDSLEGVEKRKVDKKSINKLIKKINNVGFFENDSKDKYLQNKEQFDFLSKQRKDLIESKKEIESLISQLENDMKVEFKKNFEIINSNFKKIFKSLFLGGEAKLSLDNKNILESGVEISAKPPGKSLKNINLLSGGEKSLTAVSLLFAIFEANPSPFCLLDEIDAALDQTNIKRYIEYLKTLSKNTQFIMITHRQTTMQLAESIYGVTMQNKGISKVYCVDFDDI
ncbi:MAG: chromosome segregation protein SMC [Tissierellia bacterium]|nr:chromosome segregation protein SMC [Tissierellia bacterium]